MKLPNESLSTKYIKQTWHIVSEMANFLPANQFITMGFGKQTTIGNNLLTKLSMYLMALWTIEVTDLKVLVANHMHCSLY